MISGCVTKVEILSDRVLISVRDSYGETVVRTLENDEKSRCVGTDDRIWWQGPNYYWTPASSARKHQGKDFDIILKRYSAKK